MIQTVESFLEMVTTLVGNHYLGFPDILGKTRGLLSKGLALSEESLEPEVRDEELKEDIRVLHEGVHFLLDVDERMVEWLGQWAGVPSVHSEANRGKLYEKLTLLSKSPEGDLPRWMGTEDYQGLLAQSERALSSIGATKEKLLQQLQQLHETAIDTRGMSDLGQRPPVDTNAPILQSSAQTSHRRSSDVGEQVATNLIQESWELDSTEAVSVLRKALQYCRTGIVAAAAYEALGLRYEDLGDDRNAILYYSKAIEAWQPENPPAIIAFWRGQAYYRQHQLVEAQTDLEYAIRSELSQPERNEAQNYLVEIRRVIGNK